MAGSCSWCSGPIPLGKRRDAKTCSKRCRQSSWRFRVERCEQVADAPMRFAYADPPYPGKAGYYPEGEEVDHQELVDELVGSYPDGWALSTSADALHGVWALCPPATRLHVWVKGPRRTRSRRALSSFECLLIGGGASA